MNKPLLTFLSLSTFFLMNSCQNSELLYQAEDYVYVSDVTQGLEGPAVAKDGTLYFVNPLHAGSIGQITTQDEFSLFIYQLPKGSTANGIRFGKDGMMFLADYTGHNILQIKPGTKETTVYAHDDRLNQPNDLAITSSNRIYASDPNWAEGTGNLWMVDQAGFHLLSDQMGTTNGLEVSPDEQTLYVNESLQRILWSFHIEEDGRLTDKQLLYQFEDFGLDGMRSDIDGNLYIARYDKGTVVKLSPKVELLQEIQLKGKKPTNLAFGGKDGKTVFVTLQDRGYIERIRVETPGRSFKMN